MIFDQVEGQVIFENNTVSNNIGMIGGALHVYNTNESDVPIFLQNNRFEKNMAYFKGNAVYVRGVNAFKSDNDTFVNNYGTVTQKGGALYLDELSGNSS